MKAIALIVISAVLLHSQTSALLFSPRPILSCVREFIGNSESGNDIDIATVTEPPACGSKCGSDVCLTKQDLNIRHLIECLKNTFGDRKN
ncbi:hypothetical protein Trydic_g1130 [Trypoxylus dichotomus]